MKRIFRAGMLVCLLLAALALPARAERTVPVSVDDAILRGASYLEGGVTSVPLRALCDALGGWTVVWDAGAQCAVARGTSTVTAAPGQFFVTVNGVRRACAAAVSLRDGRTYVPLRTVCEALGLAVSWDAVLGGAAVRSGKSVSYSSEDLYWLSRIISAESQGESLQGQIAVGNVVLNRVASREFPNTVKSVVFDTKDGVQFEPTSNSAIYDTPTAQSVAAAKAALGGQSVVGACLYFYAPALSQGKWINANRAYFTTIGCHRFYL